MKKISYLDRPPEWLFQERMTTKQLLFYSENKEEIYIYHKRERHLRVLRMFLSMQERANEDKFMEMLEAEGMLKRHRRMIEKQKFDCDRIQLMYDVRRELLSKAKTYENRSLEELFVDTIVDDKMIEIWKNNKELLENFHRKNPLIQAKSSFLRLGLLKEEDIRGYENGRWSLE